MIVHVAGALAVLVIPAALPSLAALGARPITIFLTPLVGAVFAAVAAELELAIGGTILEWFVTLAVLANVLALIRLTHFVPRDRDRGVHGTHLNSLRARTWSWPSPWSFVTVIVIALAALWPLQALPHR